MRTRHRPRTARRLTGLLVLALLCAQWIGLVHAIAHGPADAVEVARAHHGDHAGHAGHDGHDDHWGHDADTPVCQVVDQLLCGQAVGDAVATLPPLERAGPVAAAHRHPVPTGRVPCPYEARGPPAREVPRA